IKGHYGMGPLYLYGENKNWEELPIPQDIMDDQPKIENDVDFSKHTERNWYYLVREFVKDIKGEPVGPYQTFKDGSLYQQLIDIIRKDDNWTDVRHLQ
ncbi:MAG: hypothetical protein WA913_04715, partial [Pricia sp.]